VANGQKKSGKLVLWIATNLASIPLYFVKGLVVTSLYYLILLVMAIFGLIEWRRRAEEERQRLKLEVLS
jgi:nicotinamide mononucleotide transporter